MNWRRAAIATGFAIPLVALFSYGMTRDPREIPSPLPGRAAPDFALEVFRAGDDARDGPSPGDTIKFADLRGKVVVVNFWASWCLACRDEHEALSRVARAYADRGVQFLGVLYSDRPASGMAWISDMGGQSYPSVRDPGSRTAIEFGLYGVPETFIIGTDGRVSYKHIGPVTEQLLIEKIEPILPPVAAQ
ncbi:MAG TPA: redoxin domain-containing protein [Gemmatimonadaceae bacterium]|nr:redoxin domain-containing protein [Gemmatimonadaceae bacterium]